MSEMQIAIADFYKQTLEEIKNNGVEIAQQALENELRNIRQ